MDDYAYENLELAQPGYGLYQLPTRGLHITVPFVVASFLIGLTSGSIYLFGGRLFAFVLVGIFVVSIVLVSPRAGIVLALAIQVWDQALNPEIGGGYTWISPGRVLAVICLLGYLRFLLARRPAISSVRGAILWFFGFAFWVLCSVVWTENKLVALWVVLKFFIQISLLLVAVDLLSGRKVLEQVLALMAIGGVTGGLFALFAGVAVRAGATVRLELAGVVVNALAFSLGTAMLAAIALFVLRKSVITLVIAAFSTISMLLVSLRTGTRSVVIGVPIAVMFGLLLGYWRKVHKLFFIGILVAVLFGVSLYWALQTGFIAGELRERMVGIFGVEWIRNNIRLELWREALQMYAQNPLGTGAGGERSAYLMWGITRALWAHNIFLSILIEYNVIGLGIFLTALSTLVVALLRVKDPALRCAAGMILGFCLLTSMKVTMHETRIFWQPIMLVMVMIETGFREQGRSIEAGYWDEGGQELI